MIIGGDDLGIRLWYLVGRGYLGLGVLVFCFKFRSRLGVFKVVTLVGLWRLLVVIDVGVLYFYDFEVKCWE